MSCGDVYMIRGERWVCINVEKAKSDFHGEGEKDEDDMQIHYMEYVNKPTTKNGKKYTLKNDKGEKMELTDYGMVKITRRGMNMHN